MIRGRINAWLVLGIVMAVGGFVLIAWLVTVINNRYVTEVASVLWGAMVVWAFYPRKWWPRRRRACPDSGGSAIERISGSSVQDRTAPRS